MLIFRRRIPVGACRRFSDTLLGRRLSLRSLFHGYFFVVLLPLCVCAAGPVEEAARHFQQGMSYERLGRIEDAYTELQLAATLNPNDPKIQLVLGLVASRAGNLDVAQRALEQSIALDSSSVASYHHLALIYEKKGMRERALESWTRFIRLNQDVALKQMAEKHIRYLENH